MILQIHDELMLEGPSESSEEALEIVTNIMEHPESLLVESFRLEVGASIAQNWHEAK